MTSGCKDIGIKNELVWGKMLLNSVIVCIVHVHVSFTLRNEHSYLNLKKS